MSEPSDHFEVVYPDETGIVDAGGFRYAEKLHDVYRDATFTLLTVAGARIAVFFVEVPLPPSRRAQIAADKPDWIDTIAFAEIDASSTAACAVIDAQVVGDAPPTALGFAAAVVVASHGAFKFVPASYLVRLSGGQRVRVAIAVDIDTERWSGDASLMASK